MHDTLADGGRLRVLTVVDTYTRECVALEAASSFRGGDVAKILASAGRTRGGLPRRIQVDNGTEFTSKALDAWAYWNQVELVFSRPGSRSTTPTPSPSTPRSDESASHSTGFETSWMPGRSSEGGRRSTTTSGPTAAWGSKRRPGTGPDKQRTRTGSKPENSQSYLAKNGVRTHSTRSLPTPSGHRRGAGHLSTTRIMPTQPVTRTHDSGENGWCCLSAQASSRPSAKVLGGTRPRFLFIRLSRCRAFATRESCPGTLERIPCVPDSGAGAARGGHLGSSEGRDRVLRRRSFLTACSRGDASARKSYRS